MIKINNTQIFGLERAIKASGNPMKVGEISTLEDINEKDLKRASKLGKAKTGSGHDNYLSGITVMFDIQYPQYFSIELQRYHFLQIVSSESKMHKLIEMLNENNWSEHLGNRADVRIYLILKEYVDSYLKIEDEENRNDLMTQILNNLPMGFLLWMTISTNYLQLKTIYHQRRNHRLKEDWGVFCDWVETLPRFKELILN